MGKRSGLHRRTFRALTLPEAIISTVIVGTMLVAALNTLGAARTTRQTMDHRAVGMALAQELMAEVMQQAFEDPDEAPGGFGPGALESIGDRSLFDDVDDYDGWSAMPPQRKDGGPLSPYAAFRRTVDVGWVQPDDLGTRVLSDTGLKRITVSVKFLTKEVATVTTLRSRALVSPLD